jgi:hypothetical protein
MSTTQGISQKINTKTNRWIELVDVIVLLFLAAFIISGITLVPFHGDEATHILMSQDYDTLVKKGDLSAFLFDPSSAKSFSKNGTRLTIGSILWFSIGLARDITNIDSKLNGRWLWGATWTDNIEKGNMPSYQLLTLARACSASMGALSIIFFFLTARNLLKSRLLAWVSIILLATHGDILLNFRRSLQEGPKFLFLLITLFLATHILQDLKMDRVRRVLYILLGIASGFTLAAKQDAAPALVAIYLSLASILFWENERISAIVANILYLSAAGILAYASFLILMPVFWGWWETSLAMIGFSILLLQIPVWSSNKLAKPMILAGCLLIITTTIVFRLQWLKVFTPISEMIEIRKVLLNTQIGHQTSPFNFDTIDNKARFLLRTILTSNVMYLESESYDSGPIKEQIKIYETSYIHGRLGSLVWDVPIIIIFVIGFWVLFKQSNPESTFIFSLLFVPAIILLATVPLPWQRYFLIMQIPYALIAGAGAKQIWLWGKEMVIHKKVNIT